MTFVGRMPLPLLTLKVEQEENTCTTNAAIIVQAGDQSCNKMYIIISNGRSRECLNL